MSYMKDENGNIVKKGFWQNRYDRHKEKQLPPPPLPPSEPEPSEERQILEALIVNQKAMYDLLNHIASDIEIIKDDSVEEATDRFKALQEEVLDQISDLEKKKGKKK